MFFFFLPVEVPLRGKTFRFLDERYQPLARELLCKLWSARVETGWRWESAEKTKTWIPHLQKCLALPCGFPWVKDLSRVQEPKLIHVVVLRLELRLKHAWNVPVAELCLHSHSLFYLFYSKNLTKLRAWSWIPPIAKASLPSSTSQVAEITSLFPQVLDQDFIVPGGRGGSSVLVRAFSVVNPMTGRRRSISLTFSHHHQSSKTDEAGTEWSRGHRGMTSTGLLPMACQTSLFYIPRTTCLRVVTSSVVHALSHQVLTKKMHFFPILLPMSYSVSCPTWVLLLLERSLHTQPVGIFQKYSNCLCAQASSQTVDSFFVCWLWALALLTNSLWVRF